MKKFTFFICALAITVFASAQTPDNTQLPLDPVIKTGTLPNGIHYYIRHNAKPEKRAELRLVVNAGSTMEDDNQQGLAHFVEHMAFNGSKHFKKNDLVNYLEGIGTKFGPDLNAYTSFDETVYMLQIPTDKPDIYNKGFLILEDWANHLAFDSLEIDKERGVVTEEWRLGQGAFERMNRKIWPVLFKDSRYADRLPIGKPEILKNCTHSTLKKFYYDWYRPDLQTVIVVGDVDVAKTEKLIKKHFSKLKGPKQEREIKSWGVPDQKGMRVVVASDEESPYNVIDMAYFAPATRVITRNDYRESLKRQLVNGMLSSRLDQITKRPGSPIMFGGAGYSGIVRNKAAYNIYALFPNGKMNEALTLVVTENERARRHGFTSTELERRKKQMLTSFEQQYNERDKTESKSFTNELIQLVLTGDAMPGIANEFSYIKEMLPTITLEEINRMVGQWSRPGGENAVLTVMISKKDDVKIPTEDEVKEVFLKAESQQDIAPYDDKVTNDPLIKSLPTPQKVTKKEEREHGVVEWTLGNGVRVLVKPTDFKSDEVLMTANSWGGTSLYSDQDYRSADASNAVQEMMGFGTFDAIALQKYLEDKTASLSTGVGLYTESLFGRSSKKDLETLLQLVYMAFKMPRKDSSGFQAYIEQQKGIIQNASADPESVFRDSVNYIMNDYNLRTKPMQVSDLDQIKMDRASEIYQERFFDPADFTFVFVGSFNRDTLQTLVERYIGGITQMSKKENAKDLNLKHKKGKLTKDIVKGTEPKSSVLLYWSGNFDYSRKNRFYMRALTSLLNITLRENLREDKGGVYGVGMYPSLGYFPKGSYDLICAFGCAPDNVEKLIEAARAEIEKVKKDGCSEVNLGKIRETLRKEREVQLKDNQFWMQYISNAELYKEKLSDLDIYETWIKELKGDDFKVLANMYFNESEYKRFVLTPEKK